ncbi:MAG: two-component system chemotaxis sensor kinase CheA [Planctomycetota bacterium]|jgi:two-component system chemotaxis sensor kinase CheA
MSEQDELLREFLVESYENLDRLDGELVTLEEDPGDEATLSSIFRTIHTIKGTCGFLEFERLEKLTHAGENLLSMLRDGELRMDEKITEALLGLVDRVRSTLAHIEENGVEDDNDHATMIKILEKHQSSKPVIGEVLESSGIVTAETLQSALDRQGNGDERRLGEILAKESGVSEEHISQALTAQEEFEKPKEVTVAGGGITSNNIRVQVEQLDKLMNLAGELVLARNQILQLAAATQDSETISTAQRLNLVTSELQEGIMKVRMQPIGVLWSKIPRLVRDLSKHLDKPVRVMMEGKSTELDKTLLEAIKDPLTHLVRNAVDHGIENSTERALTGKPIEGTILLRAFHESGQVNIEIVDDGKGIDATAVKAKAIAKGLLSTEAASNLTDRQALELIFHAGLSTAAAVTNVSGRGVGMDVVRTNIEEIGGTVDITSEYGQGTTIRIKIPLTLAIIPALIVSSSTDRYAIPQVSLVELVRLEGDDARTGIEDLHGSPVYRLRGELLPLIFLSSELEVGDIAQNDGDDLIRNIVVVRAEDRQFGLVVDEINDTEEIVVKSLDKQIKSVSVYAGTTILGDGCVALILDVLGLAQRAGVLSEDRHERVMELVEKAHSDSAGTSTFLMLRANGDRRMAIRLSSVDRLEEFAISDIEFSGAQEVVQYRDEIMPLVRVASVLGNVGVETSEQGRDEVIHVVVHEDGTQRVGLVVDEITDIFETEEPVSRESNVPGIECAILIDGQITDLLDLPFILSGVLTLSGNDSIELRDVDEEESSTTRQFCTFNLGNHFFGVDVTHVQEALRHQEMTRVPLTPKVVRGVINLRGQTVTALDMRERLGMNSLFEEGEIPEDEQKSMNLVVRTTEGIVSILVDRIGDVLTVDDKDKANMPETVDGAVRELITNIYKLPNSLLMILDIEKLGNIDQCLTKA